MNLIQKISPKDWTEAMIALNEAIRNDSTIDMKLVEALSDDVYFECEAVGEVPTTKYYAHFYHLYPRD
jgi:hypothetical protein